MHYEIHPIEESGLFARQIKPIEGQFSQNEYRVLDDKGEPLEWDGSVAIRYWESCHLLVKQAFNDNPYPSKHYDLWMRYGKKWVLYVRAFCCQNCQRIYQNNPDCPTCTAKHEVSLQEKIERIREAGFIWHSCAEWIEAQKKYDALQQEEALVYTQIAMFETSA